MAYWVRYLIVSISDLCHLSYFLHDLVFKMQKTLINEEFTVLFMSCICHDFASVHCCFVFTCWERADLLALVFYV